MSDNDLQSQTHDVDPALSGSKVPVGGYVLRPEKIEINSGRERRTITVRNTGDRPIQVGSHFHFMEVNRALSFDRGATFGWRLDIIAGTAVRFEPGDEREVTLVPFGGKNRVHGFNDLVNGWAPPSSTYSPRLQQAIDLAVERGFASSDSPK
ncbi:urease subunit beta [Mycolicibacterium komossense]|uniref:Urease subunit beta n=1 Tax=Mycolicibacterium komossense TaxID=1779 RepID=A0ABT3CET6_9MYCO|nr:urease subunit beta [Mycolicibacterium komossense]MCV7228002.1 urease subunit beta [Mycolicibacterium komossense]